MGCGASNITDTPTKRTPPSASTTGTLSPKVAAAAAKKPRLTATTLDSASRRGEEEEGENRRSRYEQLSAHGSRRDSMVQSSRDHLPPSASTALFKAQTSFAVGEERVMKADGETSSMYSFSEAELEMSPEEMMGLVSKRALRPASAKGFSVAEPNQAAIEDKKRAIVMRGLLNNIDNTVGAARLLLRPRWATALHLESSLKKLSKSPLIRNSSSPGIVGLVNCVAEEEERLDALFSVMGVDPARWNESLLDRLDKQQQFQPGNATALGDDATSETSSVLSSSGSTSPIATTAPGMEKYPLNDLNASLDMSLTIASPTAADKFEYRVGSYYFRTARAKRNYEVNVLPWIVDYLLGGSECDVTLSPSWTSFVCEGDMSEIDVAMSTTSRGTAGLAGGSVSLKDGGSSQNKIPVAAKSTHDEEVLRMMMS